MILADVHLGAWLTVPLAVVIMACFIWYWMKLGILDMPSSRRKIRRTATMIMIIFIPLLVLGLSFHDPEINQRSYIATWMSAFVLICSILLCAVMDILNNLRFYQHQLHLEIEQSLRNLSDMDLDACEPAPRSTREDPAS